MVSRREFLTATAGIGASLVVPSVLLAQKSHGQKLPRPTSMAAIPEIHSDIAKDRIFVVNVGSEELPATEQDIQDIAEIIGNNIKNPISAIVENINKLGTVAKPVNFSFVKIETDQTGKPLPCVLHARVGSYYRPATRADVDDIANLLKGLLRDFSKEPSFLITHHNMWLSVNEHAALSKGEGLITMQLPSMAAICESGEYVTPSFVSSV